jgi:hypothetical protein
MEQWGRGELMVIAAVRYCMGRTSYIVGDCADWLIEQWPNFSEKTRAIIMRDVEEEFARDDRARADMSDYKPLGMDMDRAEWERVRKLWGGKMNERERYEAWIAEHWTKPTAQAVPFLDCRTCAHFTTKACGCISVVQCVNGDRFVATRPHQYWEAAPEVK